MLNNYPNHQAMLDYEAEYEARKREAQDYYSLLGSHFRWKADAIYADKIIEVIGEHGFNLVREFKLIEFCAMICGKKLYTL